MRFLAILILVNFSLVNKALAQEKILLDTVAARELSLNVSKLFFDKEDDAAFDLMTDYWAYEGEGFLELADKFKKESALVEEKFGMLEELHKGPSYFVSNFRVRHVYYLRYQYFALRLQYDYHQSREGWILIGFQYSDNILEDYQIVPN